MFLKDSSRLSLNYFPDYDFYKSYCWNTFYSIQCDLLHKIVEFSFQSILVCICFKSFVIVHVS